MLTATGCGDLTAFTAERDDTRDFAFSGDRLTIDARGSELRVVGGADGVVRVERSLAGKAATGDNASLSLVDGHLAVRVVCSGLVVTCRAHHIVAVPAGTSVEVISDGPVRTVGLTGDLTAEVAEWLTVEEPGGALRLQAGPNLTVTASRSPDMVATSTERNVSMSFDRPPGRIEARAPHGSVEITLPGGPETYRVSASSTGGVTHLEVASDPDSARGITVTAGGTVRVRKGQ